MYWANFGKENRALSGIVHAGGKTARCSWPRERSRRTPRNCRRLHSSSDAKVRGLYSHRNDSSRVGQSWRTGHHLLDARFPRQTRQQPAAPAASCFLTDMQTHSTCFSQRIAYTSLSREFIAWAFSLNDNWLDTEEGLALQCSRKRVSLRPLPARSFYANGWLP